MSSPSGECEAETDSSHSGSSDLWVVSASCKYHCPTSSLVETFSPNASTTYTSSGEEFSIQYGASRCLSPGDSWLIVELQALATSLVRLRRTSSRLEGSQVSPFSQTRLVRR